MTHDSPSSRAAPARRTLLPLPGPERHGGWAFRDEHSVRVVHRDEHRRLLREGRALIVADNEQEPGAEVRCGADGSVFADLAVRTRQPTSTHLLPGKPSGAPSTRMRRVAIVPNARMMDRTSPARSGRYFEFLLTAMALVRRQQFEPFLVDHECNDLPLAQRIRDTLAFPVGIADQDALVSKGMVCCAAWIARGAG